MSMDGVDGIRQFVQVAQRQGRGQWLFGLQQGFKRAACYQRHLEIEQRAVLAKVQNRHNVFVMKLVRVSGLATKSFVRYLCVHVYGCLRYHLDLYMLYLKVVACTINCTPIVNNLNSFLAT